MEIKVPKLYMEYVDMLVEAEVYSSREAALLRVFEHGLNETEFDARVEGGPEIHLNILDGEQTTIHIPDNSEYAERLGFIKKKSQLSEEKVATLSFLQGLFGHRLALERSGLFKMNEDFRRRVYRMPTSIC